MLDAVFAPVTPESFFQDYWTRDFLHIAGEASKFSHLFPWEVLNRALEEHTFDEKRLALVRSGKRIDAGRYLTGRTVNSAGLVSELAAGATLVFNSCEQVHRPLRDLCSRIESLVHRTVITNLYAGWRVDNGFDVHWDPQDVLILQVAGRKHWKIWKPTRLFPFHNDVVDTSPATAPHEDPLWDGILEPGGLLNIPRGWWHVANPLDEPCLHLTVTIQNHNGIDLLNWMADSMKSSEAARSELPILASEAERAQWLARVREDLLAMWTPDLIERYLAEQDGRAVARPNLSLPSEANHHENSIDADTLLELAVPRPISVRIENGKAACQAGGLKWDADEDVAQRVRIFNDGLPHALAELAPDLRLNASVGFLLMKGILRRVEKVRHSI